MPTCSIKQCSTKKNNNQLQLTLHRFPKNEDLRQKWLKVIGAENINPRHKELRVCSLHFEESSFNRTLDVIRLRDNTVPSVNIKSQEIQSSDLKCSREQLQTPTDPTLNFPSNEEESHNPIVSLQKETPREQLLKKRVQEQVKKIKSLQHHNRRLKKEVVQLKEKIQCDSLKPEISEGPSTSSAACASTLNVQNDIDDLLGTTRGPSPSGLSDIGSSDLEGALDTPMVCYLKKQLQKKKEVCKGHVKENVSLQRVNRRLCANNRTLKLMLRKMKTKLIKFIERKSAD